MDRRGFLKGVLAGGLMSGAALAGLCGETSSAGGAGVGPEKSCKPDGKDSGK